MMVRSRRDQLTADLFEWEPPKVAVGYAADVAGRGDLDNQISRLVSRALRDCRDEGKGSRADIARSMTVYLGRQVSEGMLNKWSSESSDEHRIPLDAFIALIDASQADGLLGFVPEKFGYAVVPEKYADIIEISLIEEHERDIAARKTALIARSKSKR
ncbi:MULTISPECIES: hypothetical protein [unclassified Mesorhizobium]|uniref:hypothetical protein n=1 Tax=unclassified Mesorhizobium TaxID=325217 RepID=UPI0003CF83CA|nr:MULTISPECIES: hypothetical protein [unclassified Mesorhizobium]ESY48977.1 hypothetical protein X745_27770 [Mesorhizobium sp. LNJC374B00]ESY52785.1 hypothetical protein X744_28830 [Mesorhizobium sp. LNJC372A00]WJI81506.1 hypothetical protein NLY34_01715 [Mesorhizobium sp. C374B]WJI88025.1 hypothetical protein NLY42_04130 [Mesorhizobium sp. C372A]